MDIVKGLLYINDRDVYLTYGAFLMEEKKGEHTNYSALLKPAAMKPYTAVAFREEDGEKLPAKLTPAREPRDITLQFIIVASNKTQFIQRYTDFLALLSSGWLTLRLTDLGKTFTVIYQSCTDYTQITDWDSGEVAGKFKVKFREPKPQF